MSLGRGLARIDADGAGNPVVLSHQAWARLFDRDPSVLSRQIELNGRMFTIVGAVAPAFVGLGDMPRDVFVPQTQAWALAHGGPTQTRETEIIVRLRPGVSPAQAETALAPFMRRVIEKQDNVRVEVRRQSSPNALSVEMPMLRLSAQT